MPESLHATVASRAELLRYHDPERIQGYCATCEKHGRFWSCPPFSESPLLRFPAWSQAVIVCGRVPIPPEASKDDMLARFFEARRHFRNFLVAVEQTQRGTTALIAGFCTGCTACSRPAGQPCHSPASLRYSLEAVGFDVTSLAEKIAGQKLLWPKKGNPEYLLTVGALLCRDGLVAESLRREIAHPHT